MAYIEESKSYEGTALENTFFKPMLTGQSAEELGIRVLYNMPVPTTIRLWNRSGDILQRFSTGGWNGSAASAKSQKTIDLQRVKAEIGFSAADYYSMVYEQIVTSSDVNMQDLSGTALEEAETVLFKRAIAESLRATMWVGDKSKSTGYNTFDGFLKRITTAVTAKKVKEQTYVAADIATPAKVVELFDSMWKNASETIKDAKSEGQLALLVTSDIYNLYEKYLDSFGYSDAAYTEQVNGRTGLHYHGIPVVDIRLAAYLPQTAHPSSFCILTDKRNLVLAVNTADYPGNEVKMWYNPDQMENRQRAVFMAGCELLDEDSILFARKTA